MKHDLDLYGIPGFFATASARRCARGREDDSVMLLITQTSGELMGQEMLKTWFERLSGLFYKTSGSVTSAMRAVIDALTSNLTERNLKLPEEAEPVAAALSLAVIHHDTLFVAQAGLSQVLLLQDGSSRLFFDPDLDPRGLGLSQMPQLRFFQEALGQQAVFLFSAEFPMAWQEGALAGSHLDLQAVQERFRAEEPLPAPLAWVQAKPGTGLLRLMEFSPQAQEQPVEAERQPEAAAPELPEESETIEARQALEIPLEAETTLPPEELTEEVSTSEPSVGEPEVEIPAEPPVAETTPIPMEQELAAAGGLRYSEQVPERPARNRRASRAAREARERTAYTRLADGAAKINHVGEGLGKMISKEKAPAESGTSQRESLPAGTKLLIAVLIPLLVVALASVVYITQGRENQYQYMMAQAQAAAENAVLMSESAQQRESWNQVMQWLDQAEDYRQTSELLALRVRAQNALDQLDGALRLSYKPAYSAAQLPSLQISRLVSVGSDLYLLDQASGSVLHLVPTSTGYSLDLDFKCAPGVVDGIQVGNLVEVMAVPINNTAKAPLFALDSAGHGLFCQPKKDPTAISLILPDSGFGKLQSAFYDSGRLFVLDPLKNAIWIYRGTAMEYTTPPDSYFEEMTINLATAVAAAGSGDELFLLFEDGHTMHCLASNVTGLVSCDNPYPYVDGRTNPSSQLDFGTLHFSQLAYSPPPDPSLYYLEAERAELYQFSLRLNLNRILRADVESGSLPRKVVTAFNVSTNRLVFLAFGNELYYASLP